MKLLAATTSYFDQPNLFALCAIHAARLSITHGNTKVSAFGYALFGVILCGALERFELGHQFGRLAEAVLEDTGALIGLYIHFGPFAKYVASRLREAIAREEQAPSRVAARPAPKVKGAKAAAGAAAPAETA